MTVRECVVRGAITSEHVVQFFDSDESRAECVAQFLADGYRLREPAIVVAKPSTWTRVVEQLKNLGIPVDDAIAGGMIVVKDANDTLRRVTRHGVPRRPGVRGGRRPRGRRPRRRRQARPRLW